MLGAVQIRISVSVWRARRVSSLYDEFFASYLSAWCERGCTVLALLTCANFVLLAEFVYYLLVEGKWQKCRTFLSHMSTWRAISISNGMFVVLGDQSMFHGFASYLFAWRGRRCAVLPRVGMCQFGRQVTNVSGVLCSDVHSANPICIQQDVRCARDQLMFQGLVKLTLQSCAFKAVV